MTERNITLDLIEKCVTNLKVAPAELLEGRDYLCVSLSGPLHEATKTAQTQILKRILKLDQNTVAISLVNIDPLTEEGLETEASDLIRLVTTLKAKKKTPVFIKCPPLLKEHLGKKIPFQLEFSDNLAAVQGRSRGQGDFSKEFDSIIEATQTVFQKQFNTKADLLPPAKATPCSPGLKIQSEVIGTIELSSTQLNGQLVFAMPYSTVANLCKSTLGTALPIDDPDLPQVVGEIANLVLGYAKERLNKEGYGIIQTIPRCFVNKQNGEDGFFYLHRPSWVLKFTSDKGTFELYIPLERIGGV